MKIYRAKVLCGVIVFSLAACTSIQAPPALSASEGLQFVEVDSGIGLRAPGHWRWASVSVDEVIWQSSQEIHPEEKLKLCAILQESLRQELSSPLRGEGASLRVRARIVDVASVSPALNVATTVLLFLPVERGGAAVLIEANDAESGREIARLSMAESGGLSDFSGYFSRYGHAERVLTRAAQTFKKLLEQEHGTP